MGDKYMTLKKRPPCDVCWHCDQVETPAYANAEIRNHAVVDPGILGWAYVCRRHFKEQRCEIGRYHGRLIILQRQRKRRR